MVTQGRYLSPPKIGELLGVTPAKVLNWIRTGELKALDITQKGCTKKRYKVKPEWLDEFERSRMAVPDGGLSTTQKLRKKHREAVGKDYFA